MRHVLFIRSYRGDIPWLQHCLRSIQKFAIGFSGLHIVVPADQKQEFACLNTNVEICGIYREDYMGQQMTKMTADFYTGDALVTFVDSDCCFCQLTTPADLLDPMGRPIMLMTPYSQLSGVPWQAPTQEVMGTPVEFEFMRRLPITIYGHHIRQFRHWFSANHGKSLEQHVLNVPNRNFSEFNAMGAWCYQFKRNDYYWLDTSKKELPPKFVKQHWSWGGMTPDILAELEELLK